MVVRRLHWGCGPLTSYGWVNSDIHGWPGVDVVADIRAGLPMADDSFDYVVSIHALPELSYSDMDQALSELRRVLKPGGVLRLGLPDMDKALAAYRANDLDYFLISDEEVKCLSGRMIVQLLWRGQSRSMFTTEFIAELLARNGFQSITPCPFRETKSAYPEITELDNRQIESLFIEATK
jgi:ubiquinone/menaquinone biosynthesis C-methylase UbiE